MVVQPIVERSNFWEGFGSKYSIEKVKTNGKALEDSIQMAELGRTLEYTEWLKEFILLWKVCL